MLNINEKGGERMRFLVTLAICWGVTFPSVTIACYGYGCYDYGYYHYYDPYRYGRPYYYPYYAGRDRVREYVYIEKSEDDDSKKSPSRCLKQDFTDSFGQAVHMNTCANQ